MEKVYADFGSLSTGGAIGDALFFFCSGFTLFLGRLGRFDVWYKRRIRRIYPSVFGFALVASICFGSNSNIQHVILNGGGSFISCIMLSYIVLYMVRKLFSNHLNTVFVASCAFVVLWYVFLFEHKESVWMYKGSVIKWFCYFLFMLLGAIFGLKTKEQPQTLIVGVKILYLSISLLASILLFYSIQIIGSKIVWIAYLQIMTMLPLFSIIYCLYRLANTEVVQSFLEESFGRSRS